MKNPDELLRNLVDPWLEFRCAKIHAITEDASLRMIARFDQFKFFAGGQHFVLCGR